jgi:CARDB
MAARPRADLAEKSVKTSVASVLDGGTVKVTDVTKNGGKAKSGKSSTGYYLSADRKKSKGDLLLGRRSVKRLKRKKTSKGSKTVKIPTSAKPGVYYVLACADSKGKLKEKSEHNNCKASANTLTVVAPKQTSPPPSGGPGPSGGSQCAPDHDTPACAQDLGTVDPGQSRHVSGNITPGDVDWYKLRIHEAHQTSAAQMELDYTFAAGSETPGSAGILDVEFWDPAMMGPGDAYVVASASETGIPASFAYKWGETTTEDGVDNSRTFFIKVRGQDATKSNDYTLDLSDPTGGG